VSFFIFCIRKPARPHGLRN